MRGILTVILMCLFATQAQARTYRIDIIQVAGPFAVSRQDAIAMFSFTQARLSEATVTVRLRRVASVKAQGPTVNLTTWMRQAWYWQLKLYHQKHNRIYYVMLPPFIDSDKRWIAGLADGFCKIKYPPAVAVGNAVMLSQSGQNRFWASAIVMTHELGHEFGATHDTGIMDPAASSLPIPESLVFSLESKKQISNCVRNK